jgi:hypothetical protein
MKKMRVGIISPDGDRTPINKGNCESVGGFKMLDLPPTIPRSRRSPVPIELSWLFNELSELSELSGIENVLEFSGGITTWTAYGALRPKNYVCVEEKRFSGIFDPVLEFYPDVNVVHNWFDIPKLSYDLVFIDGSSCMPKKLIKEYKVREKVRRREALMYSEQYMRKGSYVVFHDWGHQEKNRGWKKLKRYCIDCGKYEMVKVFKCNKKGFGIYRKIV